jgi:hypothetical protein
MTIVWCELSRTAADKLALIAWPCEAHPWVDSQLPQRDAMNVPLRIAASKHVGGPGV